MAKKINKNLPALAGAEWAAESSKKYAKLAGAVDYDHEAVDQLAAALNEITSLDIQAAQLRQLVEENPDLHQFVWRSQNGVVALHNIGDDHLGNIMLHLLRTHRPIPRALRGEAIHRGVVIPAAVPVDWHDETDGIDDNGVDY